MSSHAREAANGIVGDRLLLLDNNIWRYMVADGSATELRKSLRARRWLIAITPAVVYEVLRWGSDGERKALVELVTRQTWRRLMPEAYVECEELLAAIRHHRPEWILPTERPNARRIRDDNFADWASVRGGFWERARRQPAFQQRLIEAVAAGRGEIAAQRLLDLREEMRQAGVTADTISLRDPRVTMATIDLAGGSRQTEWWRAQAISVFSNMYRTETYRDWLDPYLDLRRVGQNEWLTFWLDAVQPSDVPSTWLAWAFEVALTCQQTRPSAARDVQIGRYLHRVDAFATADTRFARAAEIVHRDAPLSTAKAIRVKPASYVDAIIESVNG